MNIRLLLFLSLGIYANTALSSQNTFKNQIANFYGLENATHLSIIEMQGYRQTTNYTCGPAAVMSVLHYYQRLSDKDMNSDTEMKIANQMGTNADVGTSPQQIILWLTKNGFEVKYGTDGSIEMLQNNIKKGIPTIVEWIDWGGHWAIVTGYNKASENFEDKKDLVFLADSAPPNNSAKYIKGVTAFNAYRFNSMWFDAQYFNPDQLTRNIYITAVPKDK